MRKSADIKNSRNRMYAKGYKQEETGENGVNIEGYAQQWVIHN